MILEQLHDAIERRLSERLPGIPVEFYPSFEGRTYLPMVVLELSEFDDDRSPGSGELSLVCRFQARVIVDPTPGRAAEIYVRQLAARVAAEVHFQTFGFASAAKITGVGPDGFRAELDGYLVWMVEWSQTLYVEAPEDLTVPPVAVTELMVGISCGDHPPDDFTRPQDLEAPQ